MKTKTMGERITVLREAYTLTKAAFADKLEVSPLSVGNIERGVTQSFQPETLEKIVQVFGTTREWLDSGKGEMLPNGKRDISQPIITNSWKDEAWELAKSQINKKDETIDRLSVAFDRLTEILSRADVNFLQPVRETA